MSVLDTTIHTLGVLGLGEGRSILSAATTSDRWRIVGICDLNEELGRARQREFEVARFTTSYAELLADPEIDTIAIYTPDPLHARHCIMALEAGKHVICTKPLFDGLEEAAAVLTAWRSSGRHFMVGQSSRWCEPMMHQWEDYRAGKFGEIWTVEAHYDHDHRPYMANSWAKGGIKWTYCGLSHPVDLVRHYLSDIEEVFGYGVQSGPSKALKQGGPDVLHFVLKTTSGKIARVSGCYGLPTLVKDEQIMANGALNRDSLKSVIIRGELGTARADYPDLRYAYHFEGQPSGMLHFDEKRGYYYRFGGFSHHAGEFQNYLDAFADELDGGPPARPDLIEGIGTVAVLRAMELSLERGLPVRIAEVLKTCQLESIYE